MKRDFWTKSMLFGAAAILVTVVFVRCTKTGSTAAQLDRSLATTAMDSTIFSPFYDSTLVPGADASNPGANDYAITTGVLGIVKADCSGASCHGGAQSPTLLTYAQVKALVVPGNAEQSQLWQLITTNSLNKAMPPVNMGNELSVTEKNVIYNWIQNGANEQPTLVDYRSAAIRMISTGCTSANCHSMSRVMGDWANVGWIPSSSGDLTTITIGDDVFTEMTNQTTINTVWTAYEDSVEKFYQDTDVNKSYAPFKCMIGGTHCDGPLSDYDAILLDVIYPKGSRSNPMGYVGGSTTLSSLSGEGNATNAPYNGSNPAATPVAANLVHGDRFGWGTNSAFLQRIDSTIAYRNPEYQGGNWILFTDRNSGRTSYNNAGMTYSDGGFGKADVPIIKGWYFLDPNIPDYWKYGYNGAGIYGYIRNGQVAGAITASNVNQ